MENQKKINNKISGGKFLKEFQSQAPSEGLARRPKGKPNLEIIF